MALLGGIVTLLALGMWVYGLFDVLTTSDDECRAMPKFFWVIVVALFFTVGALAWFLLGRPRERVSGLAPPVRPTNITTTPPPAPRPPQSAPRGPDDDPEFLSDLDRKLRGDD